MNGKSENDSGAESEEEAQQEELRDVQQIDKGTYLFLNSTYLFTDF